MKTYKKTTISHELQQSTYDLVWQAAEFAVDQTLLCLINDIEPSSSFERSRQAIARLPLAQDEFALVTQRLDNAESYVQRLEIGAAKFELKLLSKMIHREARCAKITKPMKSLC